jgi:sporulation protein YlmC with PRC-barrel domain
MKETIFASELSDKKVVDTGGSDIGVLDHLRVEATTGNLTDLLVIPMPNLNVGEFETSGPLIVLPFAAVNAVKDVIVVDSAKLPKVRESSAAIAEEQSGERGMVKAKREPEEGVKAPSTRQQKRGAPADEGTRRTVSRVKEQPAPAEKSRELEAPRDQRSARSIVERSSPSGELGDAQANEWAQRRLRRGTEPPAFEHPAFRRPASEKRQVASEPQEPPKGEQQ